MAAIMKGVGRAEVVVVVVLIAGNCLDLVDPLAAGGEELLIICLHVHHLTMVGFRHSIINF